MIVRICASRWARPMECRATGFTIEPGEHGGHRMVIRGEDGREHVNDFLPGFRLNRAGDEWIEIVGDHEAEYPEEVLDP